MAVDYPDLSFAYLRCSSIDKVFFENQFLLYSFFFIRFISVLVMKYSVQKVQKLIDAVKSPKNSIEASTEFEVPARTIRSHRQAPSQKIGAGRHRYLNDEQAEHLVSLFKLLPDFGFTVSADVALQLAGEYMKSIGISSSLPGRKWLRTFIKRHKTEIKWKKEEKLEQIRANKFTEEVRRSWFSLLKSVLVKLDLMDKPSQIFNCDETGFSDKTNRKIAKIFVFNFLNIFRKTRHCIFKYSSCF
jgi:hypothetical protein